MAKVRIGQTAVQRQAGICKMCAQAEPSVSGPSSSDGSSLDLHGLHDRACDGRQGTTEATFRTDHLKLDASRTVQRRCLGAFAARISNKDWVVEHLRILHAIATWRQLLDARQGLRYEGTVLHLWPSVGYPHKTTYQTHYKQHTRYFCRVLTICRQNSNLEMICNSKIFFYQYFDMFQDRGYPVPSAWYSPRCQNPVECQNSLFILFGHIFARRSMLYTNLFC